MHNMTTKDFIKLLQEADPDGNAIIDLGGFILNVMKLPAYYDGKAPIIENNVLKRVSTGSKVSVTVQSPEDYIYDHIDDSDTLKNNYERCIAMLDETINNRENRVKQYILEMSGLESLTIIDTTLKQVSREKTLYIPDGSKDNNGKVNANGIFKFIRNNPQFMEDYNGFIRFKSKDDPIYQFLDHKPEVFLFNGLFLTDFVKVYRVHFDQTWKICDFENEYEYSDFIQTNKNLMIYNPTYTKIYNP